MTPFEGYSDVRQAVLRCLDCGTKNIRHNKTCWFCGKPLKISKSNRIQHKTTWKCPRCGAQNDSYYQKCWHCGQQQQPTDQKTSFMHVKIRDIE